MFISGGTCEDPEDVGFVKVRIRYRLSNNTFLIVSNGKLTYLRLESWYKEKAKLINLLNLFKTLR